MAKSKRVSEKYLAKALEVVAIQLDELSKVVDDIAKALRNPVDQKKRKRKRKVR